MPGVPPNCIVVLGMHRSGTSAVSLSLRALGARHGENLVGGLSSNPKGHWEDMDILRLNERMLENLNLRWDSIAPVTDQDVRRLVASGFIESAARLLRGKISVNGVYAVKDPRMTKLLPFWRKVFRAAAVRPCAVIVFRNPASVVASLHKRDKISSAHGYLLWAGHMMECFRSASDFSHILINYDEFIENPRKIMAFAAERFRLPLDEVEFELIQRDFLREELRHTKFDPRVLRGDAHCPREIALIYEQIVRSDLTGAPGGEEYLLYAGRLLNCLQRKSANYKNAFLGMPTAKG